MLANDCTYKCILRYNLSVSYLLFLHESLESAGNQSYVTDIEELCTEARIETLGSKRAFAV